MTSSLCTLQTLTTRTKTTDRRSRRSGDVVRHLSIFACYQLVPHSCNEAFYVTTSAHAMIRFNLGPLLCSLQTIGRAQSVMIELIRCEAVQNKGRFVWKTTLQVALEHALSVIHACQSSCFFPMQTGDLPLLALISLYHTSADGLEP